MGCVPATWGRRERSRKGLLRLAGRTEGPPAAPSFIDGACRTSRRAPLSQRLAVGRDVPRSSKSSQPLPGTPVLLVLRALTGGAMHGYGIAQRLREVSHDVLDVGESSLYPALQRLLLDGYVRAEWGTSENNRRARYYTLTAAGKKQLAAEQEEFERIIGAIHAVLRFA